MGSPGRPSPAQNLRHDSGGAGTVPGPGPSPRVRRAGHRTEFLVKLYFLHALGLEGWTGLVEAQRALLSARLAQLEAQHARTDPAAFHRLVLDLRRCQTRAVLEWLEGLTTDH